VSGRRNLDRFLRSDPREIACDEVFARIDAYVERDIARRDAATRFPRIAAHLRICEPCRLDFEGVLRSARRR
jgi:hypothetical protein